MTITALTLTNPGAESGNITGWTQSVGSTMGAITTFFGIVNPHSGSWMFWNGSTGGASSWYQEIDVSAHATAIDADTCAAVAHGWHTTRNDAFGDISGLYIDCLDGGGSSLRIVISPETGPIAWTEIVEDIALPPLTRKLRLGTYTNNATGGDSEAFWDDFSVDFSDNREADYPGVYAAQASQFGIVAWSSQPADEVRATQAGITAYSAAETSTGLYHVLSHQLGIVAWTRSRPRRRRMQAWTFSLDGHDFYVLDLAGESTVVYDLATGQWSEWRTMDEVTWRARIGCNWLGMGKDTVDRLYGTNVVCGDNTFGTLWVLDPTQGFDDGPEDDDDDEPFPRYVTGIVPARGRGTQSCAAVFMNVSLGAPTVTGAGITLRTSDDGGQTFYDHGTVTVVPGDFYQEFAWRGLGLIRSMGRVFEITDSGAAVRINALDLADTPGFK